MRSKNTMKFLVNGTSNIRLFLWGFNSEALPTTRLLSEIWSRGIDSATNKREKEELKLGLSLTSSLVASLFFLLAF